MNEESLKSLETEADRDCPNQGVGAETYKHGLMAQLCTKPTKLNYYLVS